jgi:ubiquinone/menaquinone biosynthesis C-methylase UbiE
MTDLIRRGQNAVLRLNATAVYRFLSLIRSQQSQGRAPEGQRILDCGAGGVLPPLALFHQHGFEAWGIELSEQQLRKARAFCDQHAMSLRLTRGDMRQIPFADESFDYVYEHFSVCHLSKIDTRCAVREMYRMLRKGGLCFLGVASMDSWPRSLYGEEQQPGEFWDHEMGDELTLHSLYWDQEADQLVTGWEIILWEKHIRCPRKVAQETSMADWMELLREAEVPVTREAWQADYPHRVHHFRDVHMYYYLRKPA